MRRNYWICNVGGQRLAKTKKAPHNGKPFIGYHRPEPNRYSTITTNVPICIGTQHNGTNIGKISV